jgi:hypothetical protein
VTIADLGHEVLGDRYELQRVIATGGMGEVWRGRDTLFDRPVAVKVLRSEYADDPAYAARFRAEAQHAAALHHPNIAAVHDYGEASSDTTGEHLAYLVMELVEGEPLSARLAQEGSLPPAVALSVLQQASAALAEAHRAGVVHRDVKPANILVRPDGTVKLTDFGIARSATSVSLTGAGQVIGTPQYMSPEQAMGEPTGPASDVYALGLVGYECLTGHAAFSGDNPVTIALKQVQQTPDPLPADLPADVRTLVDAALAKDPDARIPDGDAFLSAVEDMIDGRAVPTGPVTREILAAPAPPRGCRPDGPGRRRGARRAWLWAVPLVLLLLGAGTLGLVLGPSGGERPSGGARPSDGPTAAAPTSAGTVLAAGNYVGRPADEVVGELTALGLTVDRHDDVTPDAAPGTVTGLDPTGVPLSPGGRVRHSVAVAPPAAPAAQDVFRL